MRLLLLAFSLALSLGAGELQDAIDSAKAGDIIELATGEYHGNILIDKPLTIDGLDRSAVIIGDRNGTVIRVRSPHVIIKNLTIQNGGFEHLSEDAGINVSDVNSVIIKNNLIKDVLYGVVLSKANDVPIEGNEISSNTYRTSFKGDGIKLWYSNANKILNNDVHNVRDTVFYFSNGNLVAGNKGHNCRYSLHFMNSGHNVVEDNYYDGNSVGLFFMFSSDNIARRNIVRNADGAYGVGIGMKDSSNFRVTDNKVIYNARGFYLDQSPYQPGSLNVFENNDIEYNSIGVQFHATQLKSVFKNNKFKGNMEIVLNDTPQSKLLQNEWSGNYFDDYDGFDRDGDGYGDVSYSSYAYADRLWAHKPSVRFFYGSSGIALLNFISKLAPFSEPELLLKDPKPRMRQ